jgi:hypothetical protein
VALWTPFDNPKNGLGSREWHVVSHDRLGEALEAERANLFGHNASPERDIDALTEQNLAVLGLSTKTSSDIAYRADRLHRRSGWPPVQAPRGIAHTAHDGSYLYCFFAGGAHTT